MMVVHPRAMSDRAIYELEQFLFRGGRALLFVDPRAESDTSVGPDAASSSTGGLGPLFEAWGIEVPDRRLVGDRSMALTINAGTAARPMPAEFLVWLGASTEYLAQDDPVTARLPALKPRERRLHPALRRLAARAGAIDHLQLWIPVPSTSTRCAA